MAPRIQAKEGLLGFGLGVGSWQPVLGESNGGVRVGGGIQWCRRVLDD